MRRVTRSWIVVLAACGGLACDDDPTSPPDAASFDGQWVLISTVVAKRACEGAQPDDFWIEEIVIEQDGQEAAVGFEGFVLPGVVEAGVLTAEGVAPGGASLRVELTRAGTRLEGTTDISGDACEEHRSVVARPRVADAEFSGHWGFALTVVGEPGCPHISDYDDCFRILQTGSDLLVVDDEGGNLNGRVIGDVAKIDRETDVETTSLLFYIDVEAQRLTGTAIRVFRDPACRTVLDFVGHLREEPCAGVMP